MAKKLNNSISAKLGNFFEVVNEEKKEKINNHTKWQKDAYILVHTKNADDGSVTQWLLTHKEYSRIVNVSLTRKLGKYLKRGYLYAIRIGNTERYIVKVQDLNKEENVISVGLEAELRFESRAEDHPKSIVKLKKSLFCLFC